MAEIRKVRRDEAKFDLLIPDQIPEIYTDGVFQTMIGVPNSKLVFFTVSGASTEEQMKDGVESRKAVLELSIPTAALLELAQSTLASVVTNKQALDDAFEQYKGVFDKISALAAKV